MVVLIVVAVAVAVVVVLNIVENIKLLSQSIHSAVIHLYMLLLLHMLYFISHHQSFYYLNLSIANK